MIVKMKFLSITGPAGDIDRVVAQYLTKYDMHLENALSELKTVRDLRPFLEQNPYKDDFLLASQLCSLTKEPPLLPHPITVDAARSLLVRVSERLKQFQDELTSLEAELADTQDYLAKVTPYTGLNFDIAEVIDLKFVKYRFGRISRDYYRKFERYVDDNVDTIFYVSTSNKEYVYGVYFVPITQYERVDAIFSSLHFERFHLPDEVKGTPFDICKQLEAKADELTKRIADCKQRIAAVLHEDYQELFSAKTYLETLSSNFDVRKMAACTKEGSELFFILCGWMPANQAEAFQKEVADDKHIYTIIEDDHENIFSSPPTKLKNPGLFKPFEMFIRMYGLPAYNEMDPTLFVALTYSFLFGWMFGDVGQGLVLVIGGFLLYKWKKMPLAAIISCAGIFSTAFGFLFGSVFGFENIIDAVWMRPKEAMASLPLIGNMNQIFVVAVAFGMALILLTMIINIVNCLRSHDSENAYFGTNGIAGLVFYGSAVSCIVLYMTGHALPATLILLFLFLVPLLLMALKEPLTHLLLKKQAETGEESGIVMFIIRTFFELFEVLLSYFSNTLSFVRVGAFAVSHAAMMEVVLMLAGAEAGNPNIAVVIFGNMFVCLIEGLVVGIQVLRLEYYEFFSRFYKGNGREFKSYREERQQRIA